METLTKAKEAQILIQESKDERNNILSEIKLGEEAYNLGEWITLKNYAEKYGIDVHVLYNWIRRGRVPEENIITIEEINVL